MQTPQSSPPFQSHLKGTLEHQGVQEKERKKLPLAQGSCQGPTLGKETYLEHLLHIMDSRLRLRSYLRRQRDQAAEQLRGLQRLQTKGQCKTMRGSRIFAPLVPLFLSSSELELLWDWEPPNSPKAQRTQRKVFPGHHLPIRNQKCR